MERDYVEFHVWMGICVCLLSCAMTLIAWNMVWSYVIEIMHIPGMIAESSLIRSPPTLHPDVQLTAGNQYSVRPRKNSFLYSSLTSKAPWWAYIYDIYIYIFLYLMVWIGLISHFTDQKWLENLRLQTISFRKPYFCSQYDLIFASNTENLPMTVFFFACFTQTLPRLRLLFEFFKYLSPLWSPAERLNGLAGVWEFVDHMSVSFEYEYFSSKNRDP
jgi:hypothetical protein